MRLIAHDVLDGSEGDALEIVRGAGRPGRQLVTLARRLGVTAGGVTGIYQAVGGEKMRLAAAMHDHIHAHGFDSVRPAAIVFEHFVHGPFISLAIALGCEGPFRALESSGLAGPVAIMTAAADLARGRCDRALVGAVEPPGRACLLALDVGPPALRVVARWGRLEPAALRDAVERSLGVPVELAALDPGATLHGLPDIAHVVASARQPGRGAGIWARTADGRALAVAFAP